MLYEVITDWIAKPTSAARCTSSSTTHCVITSYSIHYTKLYDIDGAAGTAEEIAERIVAQLYGGGLLEADKLLGAGI